MSEVLLYFLTPFKCEDLKIWSLFSILHFPTAFSTIHNNQRSNPSMPEVQGSKSHSSKEQKNRNQTKKAHKNKTEKISGHLEVTSEGQKQS